MSPKSDAIYHPSNQTIWFLLAMQGGMINVGGFLELGHFVSHVTGFSGNFMVEMFRGNFLSILFFALIPLAFLAGAFISGWLTEVRRKRKVSPIYIHIMSFLALLFFTLALLGSNALLPRFGEAEFSIKNALILILLCGACGAQNALFTSASGAVVRTTHLTGLFTDFGIGLAKLIGKVDLQHEKRANLLRFGLITSFMLGSFIGVYFFMKFQHLAWLIPCSLSCLIAFRLYRTRKIIEHNFMDEQ
jgi:uncharacterized membrane protein YoaK (UPF0700 family)